MSEIALFLAPLAWLVPLVIAVVNRVKESAPRLPSWGLVLVSMLVGTASALISVYFGTMPVVAKVAVAGSAVGLAASGVFDLFKIFGTFTVASVTDDQASTPVGE